MMNLFNGAWRVEAVRAVAVRAVALAAACAIACGARGEPQNRTAKIGGEDVPYTVTADRMPLRDDALKEKAKIFHVAYIRSGVEDVAKRPITFVFNGGPGSSSVWLHLGAIGPKRVEFGDDGEPPAPPGGLTDNEASWLAFTDLVFIDPVTTGYSRAADGEDPKQFHGLRGDAQTVAEFIREYVTVNKRWLSPKFLAGESYGTTRAAALAPILQGEHGMYLNGIVLISPVLDFQTIDPGGGNDEPYWLYLPTYTATAWKHGKLGKDVGRGDLASAVEEAESFASDEYLKALAKGDRMSPEEKDAVAGKVARLTGLSKEYVLRSNLRISQGRFCKELLRDRRLTVGRLDSRYSGVDGDQVASGTEYDPSYAVIQGPYTAAMNAYARTELGFETDLRYEILTGKVHPWDLGAENRYAEVADGLRSAMEVNPKLHVLVCNGYYDLATPAFASDYVLAHMGLTESARARVSVHRYMAGHMMYVRRDDRGKLQSDAKDFYGAALK